NIVTLSISPDTYEVDVCDPISNSASASLFNSVINPDLPHNTLYLKTIQTSYTPLTEGAPPLPLQSGPVIAMVYTLPVEGQGVAYIDAALKRGFINDVSLGGYTSAEEFPRYRARYTFSGVDLYGSSWGVTGGFDFRIGRYTQCSIVMYPELVELTGLANPDGNASDDITFSIGGGTLPFTVYSDKTGVIDSPGVLGAGVTSFTVDPDSVVLDTLVTLTVLDSLGATAMSQVNVTPASVVIDVVMYPASIQLTGLANPDGNASDDITFSIGGGTPPFTVYSDKTSNPDGNASDDITFSIGGGTPPFTVYSDTSSIINSPGTLAIDARSFTVDPDSVVLDTLVTLTVLDSLGATAMSQVNVTPGSVVIDVVMSPELIELTGLANPDGNVSDDITFSIGGGTPPFTVYSDTTGVIDSPGVLGAGVTSFTVDPDSVALDTPVTLTVQDSLGATATSLVTVTAGSVVIDVVMNPELIELTGLANPDGNASDDITFSIGGGTPPFTVYSD
ncbi:hypothetical protein LCGC14_2483350, partial [marine sediment metagenome]